MNGFIKKFIALSIFTLLTIVLVGCSIGQSDTTTTSATTTSSSETSSVSTVTNTDDSLSIIQLDKTTYTYNSSFDPTSIIVVLVKASGSTITLSSSAYTVSGFDSTIPGQQTVTISYRDLSTTFIVTILESTNNLIIDMAYYLSASGLTGEALLNKLHDIINTGFQGKNYDFARTALAVTDRDPSKSNNVLLVYTGASVSGTWDGGTTWNREHVWPQSLLGEDAGSSVNMASDLQNLKPSNPSVNSSRGNKYFSYVDSSISFEPRDEVKGDIARILFYMMTMYSVLELVNVSGSAEPQVHQMAQLSVLLEWNDLDPVDDFERARNQAIFGYQNNRNPYIDYPDFVELVFGN